MSIQQKSQQSFATLPVDPSQYDTNPDDFSPDQVIGNYQLIKQIGSGGMGQVWWAKQTYPIHRKVAIKLIKRGLTSKEVVARFEAERQVLAVMDHPSIAKVFDGGTTVHGEPYLVMEYVDGVSITEFCELYRMGLEQRLQLFLQVCSAVQHAHQKGIIHRDLKPSNILVCHSSAEQAQPKVIDFGLAKVFQSQWMPVDHPNMTYAGQVLGTPQYMSPEQANGNITDIDTRADIYALGVILYELLTATTPLAIDDIRTLTLSQILDRICNLEPPRPSSRLVTRRKTTNQLTLDGWSSRRFEIALQRDLDWIVMKSIEKARDRRYNTVSDMADDLSRFLSGLPIKARPPAMAYKLGKFARKHRLLLGAIIFCAATVLFGVVGILVAFQETRRKALAAITATEILASVFDEANVRRLKDPTQSLQVTLASKLEVAADRLDQEELGDPARQAQLKMRLGAAMLSLDSPHKAVLILESACPILSQRTGAASKETLECMSYLAEAYLALGKADLALPILEQTYAIAGQSTSLDLAFVLETKGNLATTYLESGQFDKGLEMLKQTVRDMETELTEADYRTLVCVNNLAFAHEQLGQLDDAHRLLSRSLPIAENTFGESHVHTISARNNLAKVLFRQGDRSGALAEFEKNHRLAKYDLGEGHAQTIDALGNLAHAFVGVGESEKGAKLMVQWMEAKREQVHALDDSQKILFANAIERASETLIQAGQFSHAEELLQECLAIRTQTQGGHWSVGRVKASLGHVLLEQHKITQGEELLREGYKHLQERQFSELDPAPRSQIVQALKRLVEHYQKTQQLALEEQSREELNQINP
ncbi:MAG: serine/threonine-protein kinase [Pirellula sp.]|nr:serine/threonine-protein kinase [Pirellula sp.]